jgi:hypothetical protein
MFKNNPWRSWRLGGSLVRVFGTALDKSMISSYPDHP